MCFPQSNNKVGHMNFFEDKVPSLWRLKERNKVCTDSLLVKYHWLNIFISFCALTISAMSSHLCMLFTVHFAEVYCSSDVLEMSSFSFHLPENVRICFRGIFSPDVYYSTLTGFLFVCFLGDLKDVIPLYSGFQSFWWE